MNGAVVERAAEPIVISWLDAQAPDYRFTDPLSDDTVRDAVNASHTT
jgi:hypothetical protein